MRVTSFKLGGKRYASKEHSAGAITLSASYRPADDSSNTPMSEAMRPERLTEVTLHFDIDERTMAVRLTRDEATRLRNDLARYVDGVPFGKASR